ncbi:MAG: FliM/FliN family flagellar motor switch protein [Candidatus Omnitrophica bacterium]|nr:FliM/FliN family flagellar motor switch protein [Candidatus Omnitrophota bacterium]
MAEGLTQEEIDALMKLGLGQNVTVDEDDGASAAAPDLSRIKLEKPSASPLSAQKRPPRKVLGSPRKQNQVHVQPAVFQSFDEGEAVSDTTNLEVILNLNLEIRVELGKTTATVRDVLEMGPGSVLELQKLNGEPVDLLVNQKPFSKGEMIVIGENFGVRVTDILSVTEIIEALGDR